MLKRLKKPQHQGFAEKAAKESAPVGGVGKFLGTVDEEANVVSYRFQANMKQYLGWEWNVVVFQAKKADPTISEVVLLPGKESIVAPDWVPWSERRAELEKSEAKDLAVSDLEESEDAKADAEDTGKRPPLGKRLRKRLVKKQDNAKGKKPRKGAK
ncbi:MAG: DUF3027 domain-containing protein [Actinobacteria bacterium]|jgi:hypothetical protein|uniref:Unannotated protein n=1 Tax=freshwater metagenome TaxID=449393 RepID=A0A6J6MGH1_9ZZZZ|nr:DUF3027 domain-containing protein [Actinomycetota bacterium]